MFCFCHLSVVYVAARVAALCTAFVVDVVASNIGMLCFRMLFVRKKSNELSWYVAVEQIVCLCDCPLIYLISEQSRLPPLFRPSCIVLISKLMIHQISIPTLVNYFLWQKFQFPQIDTLSFALQENAIVGDLLQCLQVSILHSSSSPA